MLLQLLFSGVGSLKVICNLFDPKKGRDKGDRGLLSGINGSLVLAYSDKLNNNYNNLAKIFDCLKLQDCKFTITADLKLINILLGILVIIQIIICYILQFKLV